MCAVAELVGRIPRTARTLAGRSPRRIASYRGQMRAQGRSSPAPCGRRHVCDGAVLRHSGASGRSLPPGGSRRRSCLCRWCCTQAGISALLPACMRYAGNSRSQQLSLRARLEVELGKVAHGSRTTLWRPERDTQRVTQHAKRPRARPGPTHFFL